MTLLLPFCTRPPRPLGITCICSHGSFCLLSSAPGNLACLLFPETCQNYPGWMFFACTISLHLENSLPQISLDLFLVIQLLTKMLTLSKALPDSSILRNLCSSYPVLPHSRYWKWCLCVWFPLLPLEESLWRPGLNLACLLLYFSVPVTVGFNNYLLSKGP